MLLYCPLSRGNYVPGTRPGARDGYRSVPPPLKKQASTVLLKVWSPRQQHQHEHGLVEDADARPHPRPTDFEPLGAGPCNLPFTSLQVTLGLLKAESHDRMNGTHLMCIW